jgi:hypothetical protein
MSVVISEMMVRQGTGEASRVSLAFLHGMGYTLATEPPTKT